MKFGWNVRLLTTIDALKNAIIFALKCIEQIIHSYGFSNGRYIQPLPMWYLVLHVGHLQYLPVYVHIFKSLSKSAMNNRFHRVHITNEQFILMHLISIQLTLLIISCKCLIQLYIFPLTLLPVLSLKESVYLLSIPIPLRIIL